MLLVKDDAKYVRFSLKWEGLWCPCCGYRLRTKPRNLKYKAKLRERIEADAVEVKESIAIKS